MNTGELTYYSVLGVSTFTCETDTTIDTVIKSSAEVQAVFINDMKYLQDSMFLHTSHFRGKAKINNSLARSFDALASTMPVFGKGRAIFNTAMNLSFLTV